MTLSIWRLSHLSLAVLTSVFLLVASVTGLLLAFEPAVDRFGPYGQGGLSAVPAAEFIEKLRQEYDEVLSLKVEKDVFVQADVINANGDSQEIYLDAHSAKSLGEVQAQSPFFQFVTTLHRSLFLHGLGRIFMGVTAVLLLVIALTGVVLVARRQGSFRRFFSSVEKDQPLRFYHVILGRIWLLPMVVLSLTGAFLAIDGMGWLSHSEIEHDVDFDQLAAAPVRKLTAFPALSGVSLADVKEVEFPFSPEPEDTYRIRLHDRERIVNQLTGEVVSEKLLGGNAGLLSLALDWHTGRVGLLWALILAVTALNILFFQYSGFSMMLGRRKNRIRNTIKKEQAEIVVLAGSEHGSTLSFARLFHQALLQAGKKAYLAELNQYGGFPSAKQLVVMTATYGQGDAPSNASVALKQIARTQAGQSVSFSVVGFGSKRYPDFCRFAFEIFGALSRQPGFAPLVEIHAIDDQSIEAFSEWMTQWTQAAGIELSPDLELLKRLRPKGHYFRVLEKTQAEVDGTFLLRLQPPRSLRFRSGDLLTVFPAADHRERQYSIGKINGAVQLSVKRHVQGLGSGYLYGLEPGSRIRARHIAHPDFHFDPESPAHMLISNGTGIAPFLGMIAENRRKNSLVLYTGFRGAASFAPYAGFISEQLRLGRLTDHQNAYSREGSKQYVLDLLRRDRARVLVLLRSGGGIMICGSLTMQQEVLAWLEPVCQEAGTTLADLQVSGRIKMDCY